MSNAEKTAFGVLVFVLVVGVFAKFYRIKEALPNSPRKESAAKKDGRQRSGKEPSPPKIVDLNLTTVEELAKLPFIGMVTAQKIVEYRIAHGPFKDKSDVLRVDGVSISVYKKIEPYLTVS